MRGIYYYLVSRETEHNLALRTRQVRIRRTGTGHRIQYEFSISICSAQYGFELSCMELGTGLGGDWYGTGQDWEGLGGTGTGLGRDRDRNRNFETGTELGIETSLETWIYHCSKFQFRPSSVPVPFQVSHNLVQIRTVV